MAFLIICRGINLARDLNCSLFLLYPSDPIILSYNNWSMSFLFNEPLNLSAFSIILASPAISNRLTILSDGMEEQSPYSFGLLYGYPFISIISSICSSSSFKNLESSNWRILLSINLRSFHINTWAITFLYLSSL